MKSVMRRISICRYERTLQREGYTGHGEITVLSDGAEIMKRLPRGLPRPTKHIVHWFHIAMKIHPLQQVADHIARWRDEWTNETVILDEEIRGLKWKLWHGQVDRAMQQLEELIVAMALLRDQGDVGAGRIWQLAQPFLTYVRLNKDAIIDYGARYRSGRRIATALCRVRSEFGDCPPHGQKAADAMVKTRRSLDAASARRCYERRFA